MEFSAEMNLISEIGYSMPFDEDEGSDVMVVRDYGLPEGTEGDENSPDFHHGIDIKASGKPLRAIAEGVVTGLNVDRREHGPEITIKYGKYEVTYGGLAELYVQFGTKVMPSQIVGKAQENIHLSVRFDNKEINPRHFILMILQNDAIWKESHSSEPHNMYFDDGTANQYTENQEAIGGLMIKYMGEYFEDISSGAYKVPDSTMSSLQSLMDIGARRNYFFRAVPSMANPMGLTADAMPMIVKAQNLLIGDFLNYMQVMQQVFMGADGTFSQPPVGSSSKKKTMTQPLP